MRRHSHTIKVMFHSKNALIVMLFGVVWLALMASTFVVPVYSQFLFQFPAAGVSFWKGYLYCGWIVLSSAYCLSAKLTKFHAGRLATYLVLILAIGLLAHIYLVFSTGIPPIDPMIYYSNGSISAHSLLHSHVLKGAIAWGIDLLNLNLPIRADTGVPFLFYLPHWIFPIVICFYVLLVAELLKLVRVFYRLRDGSVVGLIFISTLTFYLLRTVIDGGLLCCEMLGALPIFMVVLRAKKSASTNYTKMVALGVIALGIDFFYRNGSFPPPYSWFTKNTFMHFIFLTGLGAVTLLDGSKKMRLVSGAFLVLLALYLNRGSYFDYDIKYLDTVNPKGRETVITSFFGQEYPGEVIIEDGLVKVFKQMQMSSVTNWTIHSINRVPPGYRIVAQNGYNCDLGSPFEVKGKLIEATGVGQLPVDCSGGIAPSMKIRWSKFPHVSWGHFNGQIHGCVAGANNANIMARLRSCGLLNFIVVPEPTSMSQLD